MNVTVLGCGPAGLTAAWAAVNQGHEVGIVSRVWEPSKQYGCQYLHAPVPGFESVPEVTVGYSLRGTPEEYRRKVYGDTWEGKVSPEDFIGQHQAWDIRETYRRLWWMFNSPVPRVSAVVRVMAVRHGDLRAVRKLGADKIISTIPASNLCYNDHEFTSHAIYANGDVEQAKLFENFVLCDGTPDMPWYRVANVFGYRTVEYPGHNDSGPTDTVRVIKPLSTNCNCHPDIIRAGRYGEWSKGVLVHEVYDKVMEALK